jgi:hypothetical protein
VERSEGVIGDRTAFSGGALPDSIFADLRFFSRRKLRWAPW